MNVYILLDRSGSMQSMWDEAIGSINAYVKKLSTKTKIQVDVFDSVSHDTVRKTTAGKWEDISSKEVEPRASTPLYDSCGKIMSDAESDNSKKTILVVMTDGYENSSKEYSKDAIKAKVKSFEDKKWEVVFLGANFDAVESVSGAVGVASAKTMNVTRGNLFASMDMLSSYTSSYATTGTAINFTNEDKIKATTVTGV